MGDSRSSSSKAATANARAVRVLVRNALFRRVELAAAWRYDQLGELDAESGWTAERWREVLGAYYAEHTSIGIGPEARGPQYFLVDPQPGVWHVRQIFDDPAAEHEWGINATVDLAASDEVGTAVVRVIGVGSVVSAGGSGAGL